MKWFTNWFESRFFTLIHNHNKQRQMQAFDDSFEIECNCDDIIKQRKHEMMKNTKKKTALSGQITCSGICYA